MSCALSLSNKWMNKHTVKKKHKFRFQGKNCSFGFQQFSHCTFVFFAAGWLSATLHQTESTQLFFPKKLMDSTGFERIENHMSASIFHEHQILNALNPQIQLSFLALNPHPVTSRQVTTLCFHRRHRVEPLYSDIQYSCWAEWFMQTIIQVLFYLFFYSTLKDK